MQYTINKVDFSVGYSLLIHITGMDNHKSVNFITLGTITIYHNNPVSLHMQDFVLDVASWYPLATTA